MKWQILPPKPKIMEASALSPSIFRKKCQNPQKEITQKIAETIAPTPENPIIKKEPPQKELQILKLEEESFEKKFHKNSTIHHHCYPKKSGHTVSNGLDPMTKCPDGSAFSTELSGKVNTQHSYEVVVLDFDFLGVLNNYFGKNFVDYLLRIAVSVFRDFCEQHPHSFFGRLGGEEFSLAIPEKQFALEILESLNQNIRKKFIEALEPQEISEFSEFLYTEKNLKDATEAKEMIGSTTMTHGNTSQSYIKIDQNFSGNLLRILLQRLGDMKTEQKRGKIESVEFRKNQNTSQKEEKRRQTGKTAYESGIDHFLANMALFKLNYFLRGDREFAKHLKMVLNGLQLSRREALNKYRTLFFLFLTAPSDYFGEIKKQLQDLEIPNGKKEEILGHLLELRDIYREKTKNLETSYFTLSQEYYDKKKEELPVEYRITPEKFKTVNSFFGHAVGNTFLLGTHLAVIQPFFKRRNIEIAVLKKGADFFIRTQKPLDAEDIDELQQKFKDFFDHGFLNEIQKHNHQNTTCLRDHLDQWITQKNMPGSTLTEIKQKFGTLKFERCS